MRRLLSALALLPLTGAIAAGPQTTTLPSGITVETYRVGETGASPTLADVVRVHYQGTLADGKEFDSSYSRGRPAELPLEALVPCWQEVLQQMKPGGAVRTASQSPCCRQWARCILRIMAGSTWLRSRSKLSLGP